MDVTIYRRMGGAKYGRNRNKVLVHNFLDLDAKPAPHSPSSTRLPISPSSPSTEQLRQDALPPQAPSPSPSARPAHVTSHSPSPYGHSDAPRSVSPTKRDSISSSRNDVSMFDMMTSDEERDKAISRTSKRRKLTHVSKEAVAEASSPKPATMKSSTVRQALIVKQHDRIVDVQKEKSVTIRSPAKITKAQHIETSEVVNRLKPNSMDTPHEKPEKDKAAPKRKTYGRRTAQKAPVRMEGPVLQMEDEVPILEDEPSVDPSTNIRQSPINPKIERTPRRATKSTIDGDMSAASPSQLGLVDLRLTPENGPEPAGATLLSEKLLPRGRKRLIDRLDAPQDTSSRLKSPVASTGRSKILQSQEVAQSTSNIPTFSRSGSSRTRPTYGRARSTYARERSHLADMVDDLDALSTASSQEASQQLASQLAAATQPSRLQMELDLESDSSDDVTGAGKLKSIHELRQAGSNNRFDRNLEALMEDIDPSSKSASKGLRLQALMKLLKKTTQDDFTSFVSDRGLDRLALWCSMVKDTTSKLFLGMIMWRLTHSKNSSSAKLKTIADCMLASSKLLTSLSTMAQLVKERKENLSKSMIADLIAFEKDVVSEHLLPSYQGENVLLAAVVLGALNDSLRRLLEMGITHIPINKQFYTHAFTLVQLVSSQSSDERVEYRFVTKYVLSVLEICTGPFDEQVGAPSIGMQRLGQNLAYIIRSCLDRHEDLVQSALRFAISYGNNRPDVCRSITNTDFVQSSMTIIDGRFLSLVDAAESGNDIEQVMLDSIILCLACLLNLVENEDDLRRHIAHSQLKGSNENTLQRLIYVYKLAAPKLIETTTDGHGQVLVAFGYLSLLICSLSLAEDVRKEVEILLGKSTMADVVASGNELLMHLRTLEDVQNMESDEGVEGKSEVAIDGFTLRFGQILAAVRLE